MKIGVIGGGQLALMMIGAAKKLKHKVIVLDKDKNCPASKVCDHLIVGDHDNTVALKLLVDQSDTFTVETENIPVETLNFLSKFGPMRPSANCIGICQDRIREKSFISNIDIPVVPYFKVTSESDIQRIPEDLPPCILKTARFGYDGKGQINIPERKNLLEAFQKLGNVRCVLEKKIDLTKELSIILARDIFGNVDNYPIAENIHKKGVLDTSKMPAEVSSKIKDQIYSYALKIIHKMNYCGVLCIEFFLSEDKLYVNELAPRPHNSGHQTIEACSCSQFEQQVRISTSMPLGSTFLKNPTRLKNLMGDLWFDGTDKKKIIEPNWDLYKKPGVTIHLYGKTKPRMGRKMGHLIEVF